MPTGQQMNSFSRNLAIDVILAIATVGSILGFFYSVQNDFVWGIYGTLFAVLLAAFMYGARCRGEVERIRSDLDRCTAEVQSERASRDREILRREHAEQLIATAPRAALDELVRRINHGARSAWIAEIARVTRLCARMAQLRQVREGFAVISVQEQLNQIFVISQCESTEKPYIHVGDSYMLTRCGNSGVRTELAILRVHQPITSENAIVFRVDEVADEDGLTGLVTLMISETIDSDTLAPYQVGIFRQTELPASDLTSACVVLDYLNSQLADRPEMI